mgnify:CR=1 FL=1
MQQKSKYVVEERILIDADVHTVWRHMTDWDAYHQWNPFIVGVDYQVDGQGQVTTMKFQLRWPDGKTGTSVEQMVRSSPPQNGTAELVYKYATLPARLGLLRATRIQQLRQQGSQTAYYTREDFSGMLARFVPITAVQQGFAAQAQALAAVSAQT